MSGTLPASRRPGSDALGSPLVCLRPHLGLSARLVCFAHAGGGDGAYRAWVAPLAPTVEVWAGSLPGRARRSGEPFARSWEGLADEFAAAIAQARDDVPVALLGHSMGGLVAFEVARALQACGSAVPVHLFVSGCRAPDRLDPDRQVPSDDAALVREIDVRYGALPPAVRAEPELLRRFLPILRADLELAAAYSFGPGPPLCCPITALAGAADRATPPAELPHWERHTVAACATATLPGGHFFVHSELPTIAAIIRRALGRDPA